MTAAPTHRRRGLIQPWQAHLPSPPFPIRTRLIVVCGGASPFGVELVKFAHSPYPPTSIINYPSNMSTTHHHHSPPLQRTSPPEQRKRSLARGAKRVCSVKQHSTTMETCLQHVGTALQQHILPASSGYCTNIPLMEQLDGHYQRIMYH